MEAVVVCVGYDDFLSITLPANCEQLEDIVVVTTPGDDATREVCRRHGVRCLATDAIHRDGAAFNKGRGLNVGLTAIERRHWILTLDADILLPLDFHERVRQEPLDVQVLYGASRVSCESAETWAAVRDGTLGWDDLPELPPVVRHGRPLPIGFFQLFHAQSRTLHRAGGYPERFSSAARVDTRFAKRWRRTQLLPVRVLHLGLTWENHGGRCSQRFDDRAPPVPLP